MIAATPEPSPPPSGPRDRFVGPWHGMAYLLGAGCALYYCWVAFVGITLPSLDRSLFIYVGIALAIALHPLGSSVLLRLIDVVLLGLATWATVHFNVNYTHYMMTAGLGIGALDIALGVAITVVSLDSARRVLGAVIPTIAAIFLGYLFLGPWAPGALRHRGFDMETVFSNLYASTEGLYGVITYILASNLFLFLVFGQFLIRSGASDFFNDICLAFLGRRAGGGAKAAVASSAIVGSVSGSAAANVAVTGVVTIPLMRRTGYKAHIAAATEAAASTGGTILPPIMGTAAFIMVALTGIPYAEIALYSAVPALLYFLIVYLQIHFYARRQRLAGLPADECPNFGLIVRRGWFYFIPIVTVIIMVYLGYSLSRTALIAIGVCILASWANPTRRMGPKAILDTLALGTQRGLTIIAVAAPVSIMTLAILLPGTGLRITGMLISLAQGNVALTIGMIFVIAYILGMGLSVVPAYIIMATLAAPALIRLEVPVMAAHFLVMWWGQVSNITPPVALAAYVAANIAGSPLWKTGNAAVVKGAGLLFIPVLFVYQPGLLFNGSPLSISLTLLSIVAGIVMIAAAIEGYLTHDLGPGMRLVYAVLGAVLVMLHNPLPVTLVLIAAGGVVALDAWRARRAATITTNQPLGKGDTP